ncbi:MAG: hypothetical protein IPJ58_12915 [Ardenticatenia bacterium]|nr:hypothetical protein [Ardenticatenia bacterium]
MIRTLPVTLMSLLFALALAGRPMTASADAVDDDPYRYGMPGLMGFIHNWNTEAGAFLSSAAAKPEMACSAEQRELVRRGQSMVSDLVGSGVYAPDNLQPAHQHATEGLLRAVEGMKSAGEDCSGGTVAEGLKRFQRGRFRYELYAGAITRYIDRTPLGF